MTTVGRSIPRRSATRRPRAAGILAAALFLVALTYVSSSIRPAGSPRSGPHGTVDGAAIEAPAGAPGTIASLSLDQIDRSIEAWWANFAAEPRDFLSATNLATLLHGRGQLTGSLDDHERALQATAAALASAPTHAPARALQAAIQYTLHDFAGALATADRLYRADPSQLGALATRADAEIELGRLDDARRDLDQLSTVTGGPAVDIRLARLAFVTGQPAEAVRLAEAARSAADSGALASGSINDGFYAFAAGEYARLAGDGDGARAGYEAALAIRSTDLGALVGLARIDAFDGRSEAAIDSLRTAAAIAPQPETLAILGDLLMATGDTTGAAKVFETVRFIERLGALQGSVYDRQLLRFELDHDGATDAVLTSARASLAARPDSTGHDLVAWALYRLGRFNEATEEIDRARADGADDARLAFHDGAIAMARGDLTAGRVRLQAALQRGPALDPVERAEALRLSAR